MEVRHKAGTKDMAEIERKQPPLSWTRFDVEDASTWPAYDSCVVQILDEDEGHIVADGVGFYAPEPWECIDEIRPAGWYLNGPGEDEPEILAGLVLRWIPMCVLSGLPESAASEALNVVHAEFRLREREAAREALEPLIDWARDARIVDRAAVSIEVLARLAALDSERIAQHVEETR